MKVILCASAYPEPKQSMKRVGIDVSDCIDGFVKAIGKNEILPFLGIYQRLVYSYFFFKKLVREHKVDFVVVTGGSSLIPSDMAQKTIVYVHYPADLEVAHQRYMNSKKKLLYTMPWRFISENLDYIKNSTIITNSNYTKDAIRSAWGIESAVIYPPCPQYNFSLSNKEDVVCALGRFTPEKEYETILKVAERIPKIRFELVGGVSPDKNTYLEKIMRMAPQNVGFHVNASVEEKVDVLKRSKVLLHGFIGEHFGIALVEAMSAGSIPIVHNSGAAKVDNIVSRRFRYENTDEAVRCVNDALSFWNLKTAEELREYAKEFSAQSFEENFKNFVLEWARSKKIPERFSRTPESDVGN